MREKIQKLITFKQQQLQHYTVLGRRAEMKRVEEELNFLRGMIEVGEM